MILYGNEHEQNDPAIHAASCGLDILEFALLRGDSRLAQISLDGFRAIRRKGDIQAMDERKQIELTGEYLEVSGSAFNFGREILHRSLLLR